MLRNVVVIAVLLLCSGCSSLGITLYPTGHFLTDQTEAVLERAPRRPALPREQDMRVLPAHYLQPGDVLLIEPVELDADVRIPADQTVLADGSIDLNAFGRVIVAGLTLEDAETLIEETIVEAGSDPTEINVQLLEPVDRYYVLGEVNSPGSYPLVGHETVLDGIVAAGGLGTQAAPCKILLARPTRPSECRVSLPICYHEITQLGDTTTNYQLRPGDRIFVASRSWCEELMFWQAGQSCARCQGCQTPCPDPSMIPHRNPFSAALGGMIDAAVAAPDQHGPATERLFDGPSSETGDGVEALPRPPQPSAPAAEPPAPSVRRVPAESLDGELNFGAPIGSQ